MRGMLIKAVIAAFNLYINLLYWLFDRYELTRSGVLELLIFRNLGYFFGLIISLGIDMYTKSNRFNCFLSVSAYSMLGFLTPTIEAKIAGGLLAGIIVFFWVKHFESLFVENKI